MNKFTNIYKNIFKKIILRKTYNTSIQEGVSWNRENVDPKENKDTAMPKGEKINLRCLWIFEVYTPNYINDLINNVDKLPWEKLLVSDQKHSEVIRRCREGKYYSWYNLGYIFSKKQNAKNILPDGIEYIHVSFFQYLPSISVLGIQFVFKSSESETFEEILNREYKTYAKKNEKFYRFFSPAHQKRAEIENARRKIHEKCYKWFKKYLPGLYSDNNTNVEFPTCEFITLLKGKPYNRLKRIPENYISVLDLKNEFDAWICDELKGIFLEMPTLTESSFTKIKIAGNSSELLTDKNLKPYGGIKDHGVEHYMQNFVRTLLIWVLNVLLRTYRINLYKIRDSISNVSFKNIKKTTIALKNLREKYALLVRDMTCFINEYRFLDRMPLPNEIYKFKPLEVYSFNKDIELFENIFKRSKKENIYMSHEYPDIGKSIDTTANIILSVTNERLLRRNLVLQIIMIILTILICILTVFTIFDKWPILVDITNIWNN